MSKITSRALILAIFTTFALQAPAWAATLDLGIIKIPLPGVTNRTIKTNPSSATYSHPRWAVSVDQGFKFADNGTGILVGYDPNGTMGIQLRLTTPFSEKPKSTVPVQINVNGRHFDTLSATSLNENTVVMKGVGIERLLSRLKSGLNVSFAVGQNYIETHLKGSSAALDTVMSAAAYQRQLFVQGKVIIDQPEPEDKPQAKPEEPKGIAKFYLPGVDNTGDVNVVFNIVEGTGLVIYIKFSEIAGHGDPAYNLALTSPETQRTIDLIRKGEEWTQVAIENRVGLFSKRIGYADDANGAPIEADTQQPATSDEAAQKPGERADAGVEGLFDEKKGDPADFRAVNFNSYEDGSTSIQIEHSVKGFSRRFNLALAEAQKLADKLESTMRQASFRLKNPELDTDAKGKLFQ